MNNAMYEITLGRKHPMWFTDNYVKIKVLAKTGEEALKKIEKYRRSMVEGRRGDTRVETFISGIVLLGREHDISSYGARKIKKRRKHD